MPLHHVRHPRLARPPRPHPLWLRSSHCPQSQSCLPTLCPTALLPACPWALLPKVPYNQPLSLWCPSPPSPMGLLWAPLIHQHSQHPGLQQQATPGPHRGVFRPGRAIPWHQLAPQDLAIPWLQARPPALVILNSHPTAQEEENHLTQRSPSFRASQANPSPRCPHDPRIPRGPPLPMAFHHLRGPPGLGIKHSPGPWLSLLAPVP